MFMSVHTRHLLPAIPLKMYIYIGFVTKVFLLWSSVFCKEVFLEIAWDPCCHCHHGVRKLCYGLLQIGESCHMKPWTAASSGEYVSQFCRLKHTWSAKHTNSEQQTFSNSYTHAYAVSVSATLAVCL